MPVIPRLATADKTALGMRAGQCGADRRSLARNTDAAHVPGWECRVFCTGQVGRLAGLRALRACGDASVKARPVPGTGSRERGTRKQKRQRGCATQKDRPLTIAYHQQVPISSFADNTFAGLAKSTKHERERTLFSVELCGSIDSAGSARPILIFTQATTKRVALGVALIVIGVLLPVEQPRIRHGRA